MDGTDEHYARQDCEVDRTEEIVLFRFLIVVPADHHFRDHDCRSTGKHWSYNLAPSRLPTHFHGSHGPVL